MEPIFIGEISIFSGEFAPENWAFCDGSLVDVFRYPKLFSLLGTIYGGDGIRKFALPDFRGRVPIHAGTGAELSRYSLGQRGGTESVSLCLGNMPSHSHEILGALKFRNESANDISPNNGAPAIASAQIYHANEPTANSSLHSKSIMGTAAFTGAGTPFNNRKPYIALNYIICIVGFLPNKNV